MTNDNPDLRDANGSGKWLPGSPDPMFTAGKIIAETGDSLTALKVENIRLKQRVNKLEKTKLDVGDVFRQEFKNAQQQRIAELEAVVENISGSLGKIIVGALQEDYSPLNEIMQLPVEWKTDGTPHADEARREGLESCDCKVTDFSFKIPQPPQKEGE